MKLIDKEQFLKESNVKKIITDSNNINNSIAYLESSNFYLYIKFDINILLDNVDSDDELKEINTFYLFLMQLPKYFQIYSIPNVIDFNIKKDEIKSLIEKENRRKKPNLIIINNLEEQLEELEYLSSTGLEEKEYILKVEFSTYRLLEDFLNNFYYIDNKYYLKIGNINMNIINEDLYTYLDKLLIPISDIDLEKTKKYHINYSNKTNKYYKFYEISEFDVEQNSRFIKDIFNNNKTYFSLKIEKKELFESKKKVNQGEAELRDRLENPTKMTDKFENQEKYDQILDVMSDIAKTQEVLVSITSVFIIEYDTINEIDEYEQKMKLKYANLTINPVIYGKKDFMLSFFGATNKYKCYKPTDVTMPLYTFANFYPFNFKLKLENKSFLINQNPNSLSSINFFKVKSSEDRYNYNGFIFGASGSGKSTFLKNNIENNLSLGNQTISIEMDNENKSLCEYLGGNHFNIGKDDSKINLLQVFDFSKDAKLANYINNDIKYLISLVFNEDKNIASLLNLIKVIYYKKGINNKNLSIIKNEEFPILQDINKFIDTLIDMDKGFKLYDYMNDTIHETAVSLGINIDIFETFPEIVDFNITKEELINIRMNVSDVITTSPGLNGYTTLEIKDSRYINFSFSAIKDNQKLLYIYLGLVLNIINKFIYNNKEINIPSQITEDAFLDYIDSAKEEFIKFNLDLEEYDKILELNISCEEMLYQLHNYILNNKKNIVLYIDEAHRFTHNDNSIYFIDKAFREYRKYGSGIFLATQNIQDIISSNNEILKNLYQNSTYIIILKTKKKQLEEYAKMEHRITENIINYFDIERPKGSGFLLCGNEIVEIYKEISDNRLAIYGGGL